MFVLSQREDTEEDYLFEAFLDSVKHISVLLKAVNFRDVWITMILLILLMYKIMFMRLCHIRNAFHYFENICPFPECYVFCDR